jgi:hypothetical protein
MRTGDKRQSQLFQYVLEKKVASGRRENEQKTWKTNGVACADRGAGGGMDLPGRVYKAIDLAQYLQSSSSLQRINPKGKQHIATTSTSSISRYIAT